MKTTLTALVGATIYLSSTVVAHAQTETYYFHNDHLGTPQVLTDSGQNIVWQGEYQPFGEVTEAVNTVEQNLRFPGQYFDRESGLHYNYFRDYDPGIGRYVESDPIGLRGGLNSFVYANSNPLTNVDPNGLAYYPEWSPFNGDISLASGASLEAWIVDLPGDIVQSECGAIPIPKNADIDFFKVNGKWYKIKAGTAYVSSDGTVTGPATYDIYNPDWWTSFVDGGTPEYEKYIEINGP